MLTKTIKKSSAFLALFACVFALLPRSSDAFGYWGWRPYGWGWGGYGWRGYGKHFLFRYKNKTDRFTQKLTLRLARRLRMARRVLVRIISRPRKRLIIFKTGAASYCKTKRRRARRSQRLVFVSRKRVLRYFLRFVSIRNFSILRKMYLNLHRTMRTLDDNILSLSLSFSVSLLTLITRFFFFLLNTSSSRRARI